MTLNRIARLAATALLAAATLTAADALTTGTAQASSAPGCAGLVGKSVDVTLDNGLETRFDFAADGSQVTGTVEAAGQSGAVVGVVNTVPIALGQAAKNVYLVNWNEAGQLTISVTLNLKAKTAQTYYSYPSGGDVRAGELHRGTLRCLG
ncbi:MoaF-related domain-containing protein [Kitasatospora viridis]|uniref:MoaF-like domain-containing protein n=1 Tax=Kitasatospora viridis TaxID=281105 RepID=A0A561UMX7_9ACTN|nr:hypothetical protein [Kitasatospora viridis]TWG00697.1 hypothetical protein FHX73_114577 [Kitasatospora viridis]